MKHFQVVEIMNPVRNEMRFEVIYNFGEDSEDYKDYRSLCFCRTQHDAANVCTAMNKMERDNMAEVFYNDNV